MRWEFQPNSRTSWRPPEATRLSGRRPSGSKPAERYIAIARVLYSTTRNQRRRNASWLVAYSLTSASARLPTRSDDDAELGNTRDPVDIPEQAISEQFPFTRGAQRHADAPGSPLGRKAADPLQLGRHRRRKRIAQCAIEYFPIPSPFLQVSRVGLQQTCQHEPGSSVSCRHFRDP